VRRGASFVVLTPKGASLWHPIFQRHGETARNCAVLNVAHTQRGKISRSENAWCTNDDEDENWVIIVWRDRGKQFRPLCATSHGPAARFGSQQQLLVQV